MLHCLEQLILSHSNFSSMDVALNVISNANVKYLDIGGSVYGMTDHGTESLVEKFPNLTYLNIRKVVVKTVVNFV